MNTEYGCVLQKENGVAQQAAASAPMIQAHRRPENAAYRRLFTLSFLLASAKS